VLFTKAVKKHTEQPAIQCEIFFGGLLLDCADIYQTDQKMQVCAGIQVIHARQISEP
jgi:hypothetical protein